ncbi:YybH family protein [Enterococcus sp. LJL99]
MIDNENVEKEIKSIIDTCDRLIHEERFNELMNYYSDDAILVVKPGMVAQGKEQVKEAFIKISHYFDNSIKPIEGKMIYLIAGDTTLVLAQTMLEASEKITQKSEFSMDRRATYVFKKIENQWVCSIDNSYGTTLLD